MWIICYKPSIYFVIFYSAIIQRSLNVSYLYLKNKYLNKINNLLDRAIGKKEPKHLTLNLYLTVASFVFRYSFDLRLITNSSHTHVQQTLVTQILADSLAA